MRPHTRCAGRLLALAAWALAPAALAAPAATVAQAQGGHAASAPPIAGKATQAALSRSSRQTVYVRRVAGTAPATELWWSGGPGQPPQRLLQGRAHADLKHALVGFNNPVFAADGQAVYVMTQAWATSNAIHRVDLVTRRVRFVAAGNSVQVVPSGRWAGHLVVMKHKYAARGGALDHYWLLTPGGREVQKVGRSDEDAAAFMAAASASR